MASPSRLLFGSAAARRARMPRRCRRISIRTAKMAYGVKPAVVRINAFATAQFRYTPRGDQRRSARR